MKLKGRGIKKKKRRKVSFYVTLYLAALLHTLYHFFFPSFIFLFFLFFFVFESSLKRRMSGNSVAKGMVIKAAIIKIVQWKGTRKIKSKRKKRKKRKKKEKKKRVLISFYGIVFYVEWTAKVEGNICRSFFARGKAELCKASRVQNVCLVDDNEALSFVKIKRGARDRASLVKSFSLKIIWHK